MFTIKMQFADIIFDSEEEEYRFIPRREGYQLNNEYKYILIIYDLYYKNKKTKEEISSHINYFVSDGHTNMFRANILFPFLCYSEKNKVSPVCPTFLDNSAFSDRGVLLKLRFLKNINDAYIKKLLQINCGNDSIFNYFTNQVFRSTLGGIITTRLENLLDLVIASCSASLVDEDEYSKLLVNPTNLVPVYEKNEKYNLDYYNQVAFDPIQLNKKISGRFLTPDSIQFRTSILKTLKIINNVLRDPQFGINCHVRLTVIPIRPISIDEFNSFDNVCKKLDKNNTNLQNYITISNKLHETCKKILQATDAKDLLLKNNALTSYFNQNIFDDPLQTIDLTWKTTCKHTSASVTEQNNEDYNIDDKWLPGQIRAQLIQEREEKQLEAKLKREMAEIDELVQKTIFNRNNRSYGKKNKKNQPRKKYKKSTKKKV